MLVWPCYLSSTGLLLPISKAAWGNKPWRVGSDWNLLDSSSRMGHLGLGRGMHSTDRGSMYPKYPGTHPLFQKCVMAVARIARIMSCHGKYVFSYMRKIPTRSIPTWQLPTRRIPTWLDGYLALTIVNSEYPLANTHRWIPTRIFPTIYLHVEIHLSPRMDLTGRICESSRFCRRTLQLITSHDIFHDHNRVNLSIRSLT